MSAEAFGITQARERLRHDTPFWGRHCATILTPEKLPVRLNPRPWQARTEDTPAHVTPLDEALERQRAAGRPMRVIILKARKLGMSTWLQAKMIQRLTQFPFQQGVTVAHRSDAAHKLMMMALLMYRKLPTEQELGLGFSVKPQLLGQNISKSGGGFLSFGDRMRPEEASLYEGMTAGSAGGGRASTPDSIHGSEVAHWPDGDYLTGLMNAMSLSPGTLAALETTANGFNFFHTLWQNAVEGTEDPETGALWDPLFYSWQDNPYNALRFVSDVGRDRFERTLGDPDGGGDPEELELLEQFGVTLEQLNWRRQIINGPDCQGDIDKFHQEHPATPEQAFIGSGSPVFPGILVGRMITEAKKATEAQEPVEGVLRGADFIERRLRSGTMNVPQTALWVPERDLTPEDMNLWGPTGRLVVWEHPVNAFTQAGLPEGERQPDGQYILFADVAQGGGTTEAEGDYSAVQVLDHITRKQVARYRSRISVHDLPMIVYLLGLYYNSGWLAVEKTGLGIAVVEALRQDLRYPMLYRTHRSGDDERADSTEHLIGWATTLRTKPLMEQTFGQALKEGEHGCRDVATAREFTTYVKDPKNPAKHGAQKGAHDDLAMPFMGVHRVASELRPKEPSSGKRRRWRPQDPITGA